MRRSILLTAALLGLTLVSPSAAAQDEPPLCAVVTTGDVTVADLGLSVTDLLALTVALGLDGIGDVESLPVPDVRARLGCQPTTTPPTPTPTPSPGDQHDCDDFPLPDGRNAQDVHDETAGDPHRIDPDGDGIACELAEIAPDRGSSVGAAWPRGGVDTGGGPAKSAG